MFMGQYIHNLDAKGRVIMPALFREELGTSFVVTKGYEHCLSAYSMAEWESFSKRLMQLPEHNADARRLLRMFASGATVCEADKQGRILLPAHLREHAGIEKEVVFSGALGRVEIWAGEVWEKYNSDEDALTMEEAGARLSGMMA